MSQVLITLAIVMVVVTIFMGIWLLIRTRSIPSAVPPERQLALRQARQQATRQRVTGLAGQIGAIAIEKLKAHPALENIKLDISRMADGSLGVNVDGVQYDHPSDIPDPRIRQAIEDAVRQLNPGGK